MNILIIGSGGREHSLALKLLESSRLTKLYCAPGNAGTAQCGENIPISDTDLEGLLKLAKEKNITLTIVGPETPLVEGIVDLFEQHKLPIIGPSKKGAQLEGSKEWAKSFMKRHKIPTADYQSFTEYKNALSYIQTKNTYPIVIKADGLAAGKGVTVAQNETEATQALTSCFIDNTFKEAGNKVVIEDFLQGEEASIFAFTDGNTILPMAAAQDHKAIYDGDKGPNTGGMGAYSPTPIITPDLEKTIYNEIFTPLLKGFKEENIPYTGIVYAGLMIHNNIPSIVEFNVRFGDPETQIILPRLENDLIDIFEAMLEKRLSDITLTWKEESAVCVVLASEGYPGHYEKGKVITGTEKISSLDLCHVVHAGTKQNNQNELLTNGGRVCAVVGLDKQLKEAILKTYEAVDTIKFMNKYYRQDIGAKAVRHFTTPSSS